MKAILLGTVLGLGAGFLGGLAAGHRMSRAVQPEKSGNIQEHARPDASRGSALSDVETAGLRRELAAAQAESTQLRQELVAARGKSIADAGARAEVLRAKIAGLIADKNAKGLFELLKELDALGEPGFPAAAELVDAFLKHRADFPLESYQFDQLLQAGVSGAFIEWCILHSSEAPPDARRAIATALYMRSMAGNNSFALKALLDERDPQCARMLAASASMRPGEGMTQDLAAAARLFSSDSGIASILLNALIMQDSASARAAVSSLESDPALAEEVRLVRMRVDPPADGLFITSLGEKAPSSLAVVRRGDIIVGVDGQSTADPHTALTTLAENRDVSVEILRDGATFSVTVPAADLRKYVGLSSVKRRTK